MKYQSLSFVEWNDYAPELEASEPYGNFVRARIYGFGKGSYTVACEKANEAFFDMHHFTSKKEVMEFANSWAMYWGLKYGLKKEVA